MKKNALQLNPLSSVNVFASYVELDQSSPLNQHETHIHKECEIYVNLSGDVTFEVENRIYPIERGSVIITRPYEYHHCIYHSERLHRHYWLLLGGLDSDELFRLFYNREKGENNLIRLSEEALTRLCTYLDALLDTTADPLSHRIALLHVIRILSEKHPKQAPTTSSSLPADVLLALEYMDAHLSESIDRNTLATACYVSVNTLERHFKKALQITPSAMLRKKRLIFSAQLLRQGISVSGACERSGFSDYSGYIAGFRQFFGITPLQYQKSFQNS